LEDQQKLLRFTQVSPRTGRGEFYYTPLKYWISSLVQTSDFQSPGNFFITLDEMYRVIPNMTFPQTPMGCDVPKELVVMPGRCYWSNNIRRIGMEKTLRCTSSKPCDMDQIGYGMYNETFNVIEMEDTARILLGRSRILDNRVNCDTDEATFGLCQPYPNEYIKEVLRTKGFWKVVEVRVSEISATLHPFNEVTDFSGKIYSYAGQCLFPMPVCYRFFRNPVCVGFIVMNEDSRVTIKSDKRTFDVECVNEPTYGIYKERIMTALSDVTNNCAACHFAPNFCKCREQCGRPCNLTRLKEPDYPLTTFRKYKLSCSFKVDGNKLINMGFVDFFTVNGKVVECEKENCTTTMSEGHN